VQSILKRGGISFLILIALISLSSSNLWAYKAIQLDQPKIRLIIPPGQSRPGRIEVENPSNEAREIKIYVEDWVYTDDTGVKRFMPSGTADLSCANWITFAPAEFTVSAFGKEYVNYTVSVPQGARGGHYAVLFFESLMGKPTEETEVGAIVPVAIRIGSLFYIESEGTIKRDALIDELSLEKKSHDRLFQINVDFQNTGNVDVTANGTFNIIDKQGMVYARGEFNDVYTFPGDTAMLTSTWGEPLPKGIYDLIITVDLGKALWVMGMGRGPIIVKEAELEIGTDGQVIRVGELR